MVRDIRLRLEGFDGDNVILSIHGNSKYERRCLIFPPRNFVEFLKFCKSKPSDYDFLMEISDSVIEDQKKFLK